jgi:hypothetical protein
LLIINNVSAAHKGRDGALPYEEHWSKPAP